MRAWLGRETGAATLRPGQHLTLAEVILELSGWIKIHRKLLKTSWSNKPTVLSLAVHLLISANWEQSSKILKRQKKIIEIGQLATGLKILTMQTGLSMRQVRTSLKILKNTDFLTIESTSEGSIITIIKYGDYQHNEEDRQAKRQTDDKPMTNERQTDDNIIRSKEVKELKKKHTQVEIHFQGSILKIPLINHQSFLKTYPGVDVETEYLKMDDWMLSNPDKPKKNHSAFARNWIARCKPKEVTPQWPEL